MSVDKRKWGSIESSVCFNVFNLIKKIKQNLINKYPDITEETLDDLVFKSLGNFKLNDQEFEFERISNNFGGSRWYIKCPKCNAQAMKLYLPSKYKDREKRYLCKSCHKLKNLSVILGNTKRYKEVIKPLRKLEKIRSQLLKKGIKLEKAEELLNEYDKIEKELSSSPEYRLYKFQKQYGDNVSKS